MSFEENVNYNIRYTIEGVDQSIRNTQRLLYFMNAVRLSVVDIQQVLSGPTIGNILWTSVQLTRAWTHLHRIIKMTNQEQRAGIAQGVLGRGVTAAGRRGVGRGLAAGQAGLLGQLTGFAGTAVGAVTFVAVTAGLGFIAFRRRQINMLKKDVERQREIAKTQGAQF